MGTSAVFLPMQCGCLRVCDSVHDCVPRYLLTHVSIYSFSKCLLKTYYVPGTAGHQGTDQMLLLLLRPFQSSRGDNCELSNTKLCVNV